MTRYACANVALFALSAALSVSCGGGIDRPISRDYPIRPTAFTEVRLTDGFWAPRLETNRTVSIPYAFEMNEETGRVDNFRKAARLMEGPHTGRRFNDTDIYKAIEGASYSLSVHPDPELERRIDELVGLIGKAQEPDGYLYTARTIDPANPAPGAGFERWVHLNGSHELYNSGHMFEAAVAHLLATGKREFFDIAVKNAGLLLRTFGPDKKHDIPGHQEVEIGLAKLTRVTANEEYLALAKFFLDERGRPHEHRPYPEDSDFALYNGREYMQDHKPVIDQDEAVGHAVRAMYMYAGMADVAALGGRPEYVWAIDRLWENVVGKKMYITGGVGARSGSEAFGDPYELPNASAYTETCAAIGNALWNHRLFLLHGEGRHMDVFERILYNGLLSGVSLSGDLFFYQNPLESSGGRRRSPWFEVACCPPNMTRFLPSLPGYVYATRDDTVFVNLFIEGTAEVLAAGRAVGLIQETRYPWDGDVRIRVEPRTEAEFELAVRIPGWARNEAVPGGLYRFLDADDERPVLRVNGEESGLEVRGGYARVRRVWRRGDFVNLRLPMPIRRVLAHESVEADAGRVALQRGPIVYCAEGTDNDGRILDTVLPDGAPLDAAFRPDLLHGVVVITGNALSLSRGPGGKSVEKTKPFLAVPYYSWANRDPGEMAVWLPRTADALPPPAPPGKK
jgi:DUF1680 family protein